MYRSIIKSDSSMYIILLKMFVWYKIETLKFYDLIFSNTPTDTIVVNHVSIVIRKYIELSYLWLPAVKEKLRNHF